MPYTREDFDTFLDDAVIKIYNSLSREGANLQASNAKSGLDTLLRYGSITPDEQAEGWMVIDGALGAYQPPASAAPPNVQASPQPTVSSQPTYSQQGGLITSGANTAVTTLQDMGLLNPPKPWYKRPEYMIPIGVGGLILGIVFAKVV